MKIFDSIFGALDQLFGFDPPDGRGGARPRVRGKTAPAYPGDARLPTRNAPDVTGAWARAPGQTAPKMAPVIGQDGMGLPQATQRPDPAPRSAFISLNAYNLNTQAAARGGQYVYLDPDGVPTYYVPILTPAAAAARAAELAGESHDVAGDLLTSGLKAGLKQAPVIGGVLAGAIGGPEPLTAAELLRNNANQRAMAVVVVPQLDAPAGVARAAVEDFGKLDADVGDRRHTDI